jgi:hypothetical protein
MFKMLRRLLAAGPIMAISVAAHALTLTNQDNSVHTLEILAEDDEWSTTIQPGETLRHLCLSPCSIALGPDEELDFEGHETINIRNGRLVFIR